MENNEEQIKEEKPTPFLKRVNELEKKVEQLDKKNEYYSNGFKV